MVSTPRLALFALVLATSAQAAGEFYCCQDPGNGRRVCGDTLPRVCRGEAYRILDSGGNLIREMGPPLTAEQKTEQAIENKRRKQLEEASREQRRRDQALLDTYTTSEDIDLAQKKAEADVNVAILAAITRIDDARGKRQQGRIRIHRKGGLVGADRARWKRILRATGLPGGLMCAGIAARRISVSWDGPDRPGYPGKP